MEMEAPGFWDNPEISNQKMKELKNLQDSVKAMHDLETQYEDIETLIEMGNEATTRKWQKRSVRSWTALSRPLRKSGSVRYCQKNMTVTMPF